MGAENTPDTPGKKHRKPPVRPIRWGVDAIRAFVLWGREDQCCVIRETSWDAFLAATY
jgi:hypothetical protein